MLTTLLLINYFFEALSHGQVKRGSCGLHYDPSNPFLFCCFFQQSGPTFTILKLPSFINPLSDYNL